MMKLLSADRLAFLARNRRLILPPAPSVFTIKAPALPQFKFEWHVASRTVYLIRLDVLPLTGDPIAENVPDHGAAITAVQVWTRGYREGSTRLLKGASDGHQNTPAPAV
jgi:hypothetical protein